MQARAPEPCAFAIWGPIARADLPGLCARVCGLLDERRGTAVVVDVSGVDPDAVCVDALARLQLAAKGYRCRVYLRHATTELRELVRLMGLGDVLVDETGTARAASVAVGDGA
jgi:ABC-type transporter Mla MlaB component